MYLCLLTNNLSCYFSFAREDQHWFLHRQYRDTHASGLGGRSHTSHTEAARLLSAEFSGWLTLPWGGFSAGRVVVEAAGSFQAILAGFAMLLLAGPPGGGRSWVAGRWLASPQMRGWTPLVMVRPSTPGRWGAGRARQGRASRRGTGAPAGDNWTLGWCFWIVRGSWTLALSSAPGLLRSVLKNLGQAGEKVWVGIATP